MASDLDEWDEDLSLKDTLKLLRVWRENNKRRSEDVMEIWHGILSRNIKNLGIEKHVILEQVIFAALDTHNFDISVKCISMLRDEFPNSLRASRYLAMRTGAMNMQGSALNMFETSIKFDETNAAVRKQKVAMYKSLKMNGTAIQELVEYLKRFMSDVEAWQELCDLYLAEGEYSKAVFCAEELLLHQPHSHLFHQRVADIRYTMGGIENLELAKAYYSQVLKLNNCNIRALYGLYLTCNSLASQYKGGGSNKKKDLPQLIQWTLQQIKSKYEKLSTNNVPCIEGPKTGEKTIDSIDNVIGPLAALSVN